MIEPFGCRWCGTPARRHVNLWHELVGLHQWEQPEQWQIKARMEQRRLTAGRPLPTKWMPPVAPSSPVCEHRDNYTVTHDSEGWPILRHTCEHVEGYSTWWGAGNCMEVRWPTGSTATR